MELHQVRYFLALCEKKTFTRAARHCGVSQPSLSNAIRRLEQELGGQLFHRNRVNCPLSDFGQEVWPHLAKLDQCARDARSQAARFLTAPQASAAALEQVPSINSPEQQWDDLILFDESRVFGTDRQRWLYTGITRAADTITVVTT